MVHNNILAEEMIQKIGKFYGKAWIRIHKCTNIWELSYQQGKNIKYGTNHKYKDMLIVRYSHIPEENS